jgi:hypothetical protein
LTNNWKANDLRKSIILDPHRFKVVVAGRRWGKSYLSLMWLLTKEIQPGERRWIVGPTYRSLKSTTWPILRAIMRQHEGAVINESDLSIKLPNDSEIALKGSEQENNLRGAGLDMVVMEEFSYIKPHVYEEIIYPMLTTTQGDALFIGTPNSFDHLYDYYLRGQSDPDWKSWQFTTEQGGFVPKDEIERAKATMDENTYKTEFLADFVSTGSRAAYNFDRKIHVKQAEELTANLFWGIDFNVDYMTAVLGCEYSDGTIHYFDEIRQSNSNTENISRAMKKIAPGINVYPDSSGRNRSTTSNKSDHQILIDNGFNVVAKKANPPIIDRINSLNRLLLDANGKIRMTVDPKCTYLIKDLEQVQRSRDGKIEKLKDITLSHAFDACSYYIAMKHPLVKRSVMSSQW